MTSNEARTRATRKAIAQSVITHLGVDQKSPDLKRLLDEIMDSTPWLVGEPVEVTGLVSRDEVAERLGVIPVSVSNLALRDEMLPKKIIGKEHYWSAKEINAYAIWRKNRPTGSASPSYTRWTSRKPAEQVAPGGKGK